MKLEYKLSNGNYVAVSDNATFIAKAARWADVDIDVIVAKLQSGNSVRIGSDWYETMRVVPVRNLVQEQRSAAILGNDNPPAYDDYENV